MPKEFERKITVEEDGFGEFVKKYWPIGLAVAGAGAVGAAIWMTARYLRNKHIKETEMAKSLEMVEQEAMESLDPTATMLETGSYLGHVAGQEAADTAMKLAHSMPDDETRLIMETLGTVAQMEAKKK